MATNQIFYKNQLKENRCRLLLIATFCAQFLFIAVKGLKFTFRAYTKNTRFPNGHPICKTLSLAIFVDTSLSYMSQFRR